MKPTEAPRNQKKKKKKKDTPRGHGNGTMEHISQFFASFLRFCFCLSGIHRRASSGSAGVGVLFHGKLDLNGFIATVPGQPEAI